MNVKWGRRLVLFLAALAVTVSGLNLQPASTAQARPERHTCPKDELAYPARMQDPGPEDTDTTDAVEYAGIAEGSRSWYDAAQNRFYTIHARSSVAHEAIGTCSDYDIWAYRLHVWCTSEYGPLTYTTPCNYDLDHAALRVKYCREFTSCPSSEPWGFRHFHRDNDADYIFQGGWHTFGTPGTQQASLLSFSERLQARFLSSTGQHLTGNYVACSAWVWEGNTDYQADTSCSGLIGPV